MSNNETLTEQLPNTQPQEAIVRSHISIYWRDKNIVWKLICWNMLENNNDVLKHFGSYTQAPLCGFIGHHFVEHVYKKCYFVVDIRNV